MSASVAIPAPRRSAKVIGLVSTAHFFSHFYMFLIPPLLPLMRDAYGVGFTELGFALTVMSLATALTQIPVGFGVDRFGARGLLIGGLLLHGVAIALIGVFPTYSAFVVFLALAGLANSVYHPADYAILNASVEPRRMGRAFSIHTTAGYAGDALAPVTILFLASVLDWRIGLILCGLFGITTALAVGASSSVLRDATDGEVDDHRENAGAGSRTGIALLMSLPILMGLVFYFGIGTTGRGVTGFGVSVLHVARETPLGQAGIVISAWLFASPIGVLAGGWVADRTTRHDAFVAGCFVVIATVIFLVAGLDLPLLAVAGLFVIGGFCSGMVSPSRDMLVRSLTPPGQIGKVFGFVSTGFNLSGIVAPPIFGYVLDHSAPENVFWISGVIALTTVITVLATGRQGRGRRAAGRA